MKSQLSYPPGYGGPIEWLNYAAKSKKETCKYNLKQECLIIWYWMRTQLSLYVIVTQCFWCCFGAMIILHLCRLWNLDKQEGPVLLTCVPDKWHLCGAIVYPKAVIWTSQLDTSNEGFLVKKKRFKTDFQDFDWLIVLGFNDMSTL